MVTSSVLTILLTTVCTTIADENLFVTTMIKGNFAHLRAELLQFKADVTKEITSLEDRYLYENFHHKDFNCMSKTLQKARMETQKLLNMLVVGELNGLAQAEESIDYRSLPELDQLWGAVVFKGQTREDMKTEMKNYEELVKQRFQQAASSCDILPMEQS